MKPTCQHCHRAPVNRPKDLCWACYYTPGVRDLYPSTSKFAARGHGAGVWRPKTPARPTSASPGTPEKVRVMERRVSRGESPFHPADAKGGG